MDSLTTRIKNRLLLLGAPPFEAPYLAREAMFFARAFAINADDDVAWLAELVWRLGDVLREPRDLELAIAVLARAEAPPAERFTFLERTWLGDTRRAETP